MFVSSMAPLLLVFALLDTFGNDVVSWACVAVAVVAVASHAALLMALHRGRLGSATHERRYQLSDADERGGDVMAYVATYLIPFAGFSVGDLRSFAALGLFLAVLGVLYVRSGLFAINPVLAMAGYHLYRAELNLASGQSRTTNLLIRADVPSGPVTVQAHQLGSDLLVSFRKEHLRGHKPG